MRKLKNKKTIAVLLMIVFSTIMMPVLSATAVSDDVDYVYYNIPAEKVDQINEAIGGEFEPTRGIFCIFGHNIDTGWRILIQHRYWAVAPRCRETITYFEYCTRSSCDYLKVTGESVNKLYCCP